MRALLIAMVAVLVLCNCSPRPLLMSATPKTTLVLGDGGLRQGDSEGGSFPAEARRARPRGPGASSGAEKSGAEQRRESVLVNPFVVEGVTILVVKVLASVGAAPAYSLAGAPAVCDRLSEFGLELAYLSL